LESVNSATLAKVTVAASLGTLMEWYDFFLAGTAAAQVWPLVFFSRFSDAVALALSVAAYGIVFFTRPIGSWLFGHLGDRYGRKSMLFWTLVLMGVGTLGLALTPSYAAIGILAPILLNLFRSIQGIGLGGEWGGATGWVVEFAAKSKHRAFWSGWVQWTVPLGTVLSIISFILVARSMSPAAYLEWGWRIPFLVGAVVAIVAIVIRYSLKESPLFSALLKGHAVEKSPFTQMLKESWKRVTLLAVLFSYISVTYSGIMNPISVSYMSALKIAPTDALLYVTYGVAFSLITLLVGAILGDIIGRRMVAVIATSLTAIATLAFFPLVNTLVASNIIMAQACLIGSAYLFLGVVPAFYNENFPTRFRYSGSGFSFQMGNLLAGVVITFAIPITISSSGGLLKAWPVIAALGVIFAIASLIAALVLKDTKDAQL
jgi:MFS family permease